MQNNTQTPTLEQMNSLKIRLNVLVDEDLKPKQKTVYNSKIDQLRNDLDKAGISKDLTLREAERALEKWIELLSQNQETVTEVPRPTGPEATTLTSNQLENLGEYAEKRDAAIKQTRDKASSDVANTQARLKEIYDQQRIIQEQIKKAEELQPKFVGKKVYATVEQQELVVNLEAQKSFETLTQAAIYNEYDLTDQLTAAVQEKAGIAESEILVAKTLAVQLVSDIAHSEETKKELENIAIEEALAQNKDKVLEQVLQQENALIEVAKKGSIIEAEKLKESVYLTREIAENLFGEDVANEIYGPKQIKVVLISEKNEKTTHEIDLGNANKASIKSYKERYDFFEKVRKVGIDETKNIFRSQLSSNVNTYLSKKAISSPNSLLGKMGSSDAVKAILTKGSSNPLELEYIGNKYLKTFFELSPDSMPYFKLFTEVTGVSVGVGVATKIVPLTFGGGAIPITKIAYIQRITPLRVPYTLGKTVGGKFAVGLGARTAAQTAGQAASQAVVQTGAKAGIGATLSATLSATFGSFAPVVGHILGAIAGWIGGELLSKLQVWWKKNKESIKPFLVGGLAGGGLLLGGPGVGLAGLGLGLAATGTLGAFATGTFGVLGFIGRSIGIAIATPVIITLLTLPPLVAFIMLIINNSAYVVPPGSLGDKTISIIESPYIGVTKTAEPTGPLSNSDIPITVTYKVTIRAKKNGLTNIKIKDSCQVISKDSIECPVFTSPDPSIPTSISPTSTFTFNYKGRLDKKFNDSVVINTITVTADDTEQKGATSEVSSSITIGNPPISCPVPGATPDNSMNYSYNSSNNTGHGSNAYWTAMCGNDRGCWYYYPLPQSTSCKKPGDCPYYGYAYDVFPNGSNDVFAPSVLGKDVTWNCEYAFSNGGGKAGHTYYCNSTDGNFHLVLTHMKNGAKTGNIKSGEKIGTLYNQGGNTHLHIEFQADGRWQKPENYFCK